MFHLWLLLFNMVNMLWSPLTPPPQCFWQFFPSRVWCECLNLKLKVTDRTKLSWRKCVSRSVSSPLQTHISIRNHHPPAIVRLKEIKEQCLFLSARVHCLKQSSLSTCYNQYPPSFVINTQHSQWAPTHLSLSLVNSITTPSSKDLSWCLNTQGF